MSIQIKEEPMDMECAVQIKALPMDMNYVSIDETKTSTNSKKKPRRKARLTMGTKKIKTEKIEQNGLYRFNSFLSEETGNEIYTIQFNRYIQDRSIFATASGYRVSVYECVDDEQCGLKLQLAYDDPDVTESFYTLAWSYERKVPVIAVGGFKAIIRIIYLNDERFFEKKLMGHTSAINELKFHPNDPNLLLSASKDYSLRLFNIKTAACIAKFGGVGGHKDEAITIDFDWEGKHICSGGMDHYLKIWKIDTDEIESAIKLSSSREKRCKPLIIHFPVYSTRDIHRNYVDSVKYMGNLIFSKSSEENEIICWKPGNLNEPTFNLNSTNFTTVRKFKFDTCDYWFMRIEVDTSYRFMAVGNTIGKIFLYDLDAKNTAPISILAHHRATKAIRQISFSNNSEIIVASSADGKVYRWDKQELDE